jgi:hypothetical protein
MPPTNNNRNSTNNNINAGSNNDSTLVPDFNLYYSDNDKNESDKNPSSALVRCRHYTHCYHMTRGTHRRRHEKSSKVHPDCNPKLKCWHLLDPQLLENQQKRKSATNHSDSHKKRTKLDGNTFSNNNNNEDNSDSDSNTESDSDNGNKNKPSKAINNSNRMSDNISVNNPEFSRLKSENADLHSAIKQLQM